MKKKNSINLLFDVKHNHNSIRIYNFILAVVFFYAGGRLNLKKLAKFIKSKNWEHISDWIYLQNWIWV